MMADRDPMTKATQPATLAAILHALCPRCRMGQIFASSIYFGFPKMRERCAVCDLKFEREPGYFLGAMYISYALGLGTILLLAALLWIMLRLTVMKTFFWAVVGFIPLAPAITYLSRVMFIYLDQAIDPERKDQEHGA